MLLPPLPSRVGRRGKITDHTGTPHPFVIEDEITHAQSDYPEKVLCLQKLRFEDTGQVELRLGYYVIGHKGWTAGRWVWGQYSTGMSGADFRALAEKAAEKGWL